MNKHYIQIEIEDGEVKKILNKLDEAQQTIQDCYDELHRLGVLVIKSKPPAATDG